MVMRIQELDGQNSELEHEVAKLEETIQDLMIAEKEELNAEK